MFQGRHLRKFEDSLKHTGDSNNPGRWKGKDFGTGIKGVNPSELPEDRVTRGDISRLLADGRPSTVTVCAAIMAWGSMHKGNRRSFFVDGSQEWRRLAEEIRCGRLNRKEAYERFSSLKRQGKLKGAGPAYFTKLIHFLMPRNGRRGPGWIMDQWAGCSINLLLGTELVLMDVTRKWKFSGRATQPKFKTDFTVSDVNTAERYEEFCRAVDCLADRFNLCPDKADRPLVSAGGRNPEPWREYVMEHRHSFIRCCAADFTA